MSIDRRTFLRGGAAAAAAFALPAPFAALARGDAPMREGPGYGPLAPVTDRLTGLPLLRLPPGFRYTSFGWSGQPMRDGRPTPPGHDGAAALAGPDGRVHYLRNHELHYRPDYAFKRSFAPPERTYDAGAAPGGVTVVSFDPARGEALETWPALGGTVRNCAGGPTPWNTWLTCEETVEGPEGALYGAGVGAPHGFVFEVPADGRGRPEPLRAMGRFRHEAVAVDPATGFLYETEDTGRSGLYRFRPAKPGRLAAGGRLEMLAVRGERRFDTSRGLDVGQQLDVHWVSIGDPERAHVDARTLDGMGVFSQGEDRGGASFRRGEGAWFAGGRLYFVATTGGRAGAGQVFELDPAHDRLRLVYESPGAGTLDHPDNLTVSPRGGLVLCEDGKRDGLYLRGLTPDGEIFDLARNDLRLEKPVFGHEGDFRDQEWAGACFTPDGRWLLASIQTPGVSFAITGPWERGVL